jgi:hypothetical protein
LLVPPKGLQDATLRGAAMISLPRAAPLSVQTLNSMLMLAEFEQGAVDFFETLICHSQELY